MLGEKFGHFCLNRLRQQGTRSVAQQLGERVSKRPWLKQLDHGSIGHGVSLLCWRSGGANTPTIRRLLPIRPSPTFANTSLGEAGNVCVIEWWRVLQGRQHRPLYRVDGEFHASLQYAAYPCPKLIICPVRSDVRFCLPVTVIKF